VPLEVELKLSITADHATALSRAAPIKAAAVGRASTAHLYSIYYDTPKFDLRDNGVALRLRRAGKRWVQTVKSGGRVDAGLHQREEIETPLAAQIINYRVLAESGLADIFSEPQLPLQLAPVFVTDFKRTTRILEPAAGTRIELCLDRGTISAGAASTPISEVELELKAGSQTHLIDFALALIEHIPMRLESVSKAERGYALAAGAAPAAVKAGALELSEQMSVTDALRTIVFGCIAHLQANERGLLEDDDIEYVHQARVAVRRLRSAFSIFRPAFPLPLFAEQLEELRWLADVLGQARDWDVLLSETLPAMSAALAGEASLNELMERCIDLRSAARTAARMAVAARRYTALLLELTGVFLRAPWSVGADDSAPERERPLIEFAGAVLNERHRKVMKQSGQLDQLDATQLHRLRIRIKKLRYAAEFFATLYSRKAVRDYVRALSGLQELLGTLNDAATADRIARALREDGKPDQLEGLGLLRGWSAARAQTSRKQLTKAWSKFEECEVFWE